MLDLFSTKLVTTQVSLFVSKFVKTVFFQNGTKLVHASTDMALSLKAAAQDAALWEKCESHIVPTCFNAGKACLETVGFEVSLDTISQTIGQATESVTSINPTAALFWSGMALTVGAATYVIYNNCSTGVRFVDGDSEDYSGVEEDRGMKVERHPGDKKPK